MSKARSSKSKTIKKKPRLIVIIIAAILLFSCAGLFGHSNEDTKKSSNDKIVSEIPKEEKGFTRD